MAVTDDANTDVGEMTFFDESSDGYDLITALWCGAEAAWMLTRSGVDQALTSVLAALGEAGGGGDPSFGARPPLLRARAFVADAELKVRVEAALHADPLLDECKVEVESVYDGLVVVAGHVTTSAMHRRAFEVAATVSGVRRVTSAIEVEPAVVTHPVELASRPATEPEAREAPALEARPQARCASGGDGGGAHSRSRVP